MAEELREYFIRLRSRKDGAWLVHPELKAKLVADAEEDGSNMTEIATRILSKIYNVPFVPVGRKTNPRPDTHEIHIKLPANLSHMIEMASLARFGRARPAEEIRLALHSHYGLRVPAQVKRTRKRRVDSTRAAA